jgi:hypothetical protein
MTDQRPIVVTKLNCYASQHMHPREWGLLDVCLRLTNGGTRNLFFDGRKMAARFSGSSKSAIYRGVARLEKAGWLVQINTPGKRNKKTKRYEKSIYQVLTHEQWTAKRGTKKCRQVVDNPSPNSGNGDGAPSPTIGNGASPTNESSQSHFRDEPVPFLKSPVPELGHSSFNHSSIKTSLVKNNPVKDSPTGTGVEDSDSNPDRGSKKKLPSGVRRINGRLVMEDSQ